MLYFIVVMYCFLLYVYLYYWVTYLGQDTPGKEIFYLSEVLSWLNKGIKKRSAFQCKLHTAQQDAMQAICNFKLHSGTNV